MCLGNFHTAQQELREASRLLDLSEDRLEDRFGAA
jgi:hypothetical protein